MIPAGPVRATYPDPRDTALTMPQGKVEMVRLAMEAFGRRDFDTALEYMTEDATWAPFLARTETSLLRGKSEIRAAWERQFEVMDDLRAEILEVIADENDRVITWTLMRARGQGSDMPTEGRVAHVFTFRDGLVSNVESFDTVSDALKAAGLRE